MNNENRKIIAYIVACVSEFARDTSLTSKEAFMYLEANGGIDFLIDCYDTEHLLSLNDAVGDLKRITQNAGDLLA